MKRYFKVWQTVYANDNDAFIPEMWAQESLMILEANLVAAALVHRNFENEVANFGDVVNTRRPATFTSTRKVDGDAIVNQDAQATNVPVKLDQHWYTSFMIYDGEASKSFKDLVATYLTPAVSAIANSIDQAVLTQAYRFIPAGNVVGKLGTAIGKSTIIDAREVLNTNKVPLTDRRFVIGSSMEGDLLSVGDFTKVNEAGDMGAALREGNIGRKFGFDFFMDQNSPAVAAGSTTVAGAVNNASGYAAGSTAITVDGLSAAITAGAWCTIAGDMTPQKITGTTGGSTPTALAISPGLKNAVVNDAVVTIYTPGAINNSSTGYAAGYTKPMTVNGFSVAPKSGQLISLGAAAVDANYIHGANGTPTTTSLLLDRSLYATAAHASVVGVGPAGDYGFAFHKNAVGLITRPLAAPARGTGALSYVANYNGLAIRVTISYNATYQGHQVTVDILGGLALFDANLGVLICG